MVFFAAASSFSSLWARSSRYFLSCSKAWTAACRDWTEAPSLCSSDSCEENTFSSVYRTQEGKSLITEPSKTKMLKCLCHISAFVTFELMSVQSCVWFPPHSSGFVPAAPSLQLRHCFCGWTVGGQPSRRQTAPLRCSHCQIHQKILQLKYTITPKNRHSGPQLLQDYFQNAWQKIIFCLVDKRSMIRRFYKECLLFCLHCSVTLLVKLFLVHKEWKRVTELW